MSWPTASMKDPKSASALWHDSRVPILMVSTGEQQLEPENSLRDTVVSDAISSAVSHDDEDPPVDVEGGADTSV